MACNCGRKADGSTKTFRHTMPAGKTYDNGDASKVYDSEIQARVAASRYGGTVRQV